jgi:hypothetical protein
MQIPRFRCKMTLHFIPEHEEKASELLRDLTANDRCNVLWINNLHDVRADNLRGDGNLLANR